MGKRGRSCNERCPVPVCKGEHVVVGLRSCVVEEDACTLGRQCKEHRMNGWMKGTR